MFELPNIVFNAMFTCFGCARQNVAEKMEIIARLLPTFELPESKACTRIQHFFQFFLNVLSFPQLSQCFPQQRVFFQGVVFQSVFSQSVISQSVFSQCLSFRSIFIQSVFIQSVFFQSVFIQRVFLQNVPALHVF